MGHPPSSIRSLSGNAGTLPSYARIVLLAITTGMKSMPFPFECLLVLLDGIAIRSQIIAGLEHLEKHTSGLPLQVASVFVQWAHRNFNK
ncbi:hypothetical protein F475_03825 [Pseudomonas sp. URMO17WK12:I6]|nr:hypothetical protein F475_03825 [Pseudomonas sp. URMO17WK12:I6]